MDVRWTLTRIETTYQWYQSCGNWMWEPVTSRNRVAEGEVTLAAEASEIAVPVEWGEYEILVEATGDVPAATSTTFYAGWYASADASATPDTLEAWVDEILATLVANGPKAARECKRLVRDVGGQPITEALRSETARRIADVRASDEGREGLQSFLGKRAPGWLPAA